MTIKQRITKELKATLADKHASAFQFLYALLRLHPRMTATEAMARLEKR